MAKHRGKGHPAMTEPDVIEYLQEVGVAGSQEIADRFDVSDVGARKRLKEFNRVDSRKMWRDRLVWYVPHTPQPDGYGMLSGSITPAAGKVAIGFAGASIIAVLAHVVLLSLNSDIGVFLPISVSLLGLSVISLWAWYRWRELADPSAEFQDVARAAEAGKE